MTGKEKFDIRMKVSGGSIRNQRIMAMRNFYNSYFESDPSSRNDITIWNTDIRVPAKIYEHKHKEASPPRRQIQTPYNVPIKVGTIFQIGNDGHWMCIDMNFEQEMHYQGTIEYCNYLLRFMLDGEIKEYPVVIKNATQYNSGETSKPLMTIGSSQHLIYIPYDEVTISLDNGTRFLIDKNRNNPTAYRLTQCDATSYSYLDGGLLQLTVTEDQYSPIADNKELMIADYYSTNVNHCGNLPQTRIVILGDEEIFYNSEATYQIEIYKDGKCSESSDFSFEVIHNSDFITVVKDSKRLTIKVNGDKQLIGKQFKLHVWNDVLGVNDAKTIFIKGWY